MPIDFFCTQCGKRLRVADEYAGRNAQCPSCAALLTVPAQNPALPVSNPAAPAAGQAPQAWSGPPSLNTPENPYAASQVTGLATNQVLAGQIVPTVVSMEHIWGTAWRIFSARMWVCVLVGVIYFILCQVLPMLLQAMGYYLQATARNPALGGLLNMAGYSLGVIVGSWLQVGYLVFNVKIARGEQADVHDLFVGGTNAVTLFVVNLLVGLAVGVGTLFCIVPGIYLAMMLWPAPFLHIDKKLDIMQAITVASKVTEGNKSTSFLLYLACMLIIIISLITIIGPIFTGAFFGVVLAVAYLKMTGQAVADPAEPGQLPA
jgi:hypothetical protein